MNVEQLVNVVNPDNLAKLDLLVNLDWQVKEVNQESLDSKDLQDQLA